VRVGQKLPELRGQFQELRCAVLEDNRQADQPRLRQQGAPEDGACLRGGAKWRQFHGEPVLAQHSREVTCAEVLELLGPNQQCVNHLLAEGQ